MKVLLFCFILFLQAAYAAPQSAMVAATLKINQVAEELALEHRKVRTCSNKLDELQAGVTKKETIFTSLTKEVKDIRATVSEQNGLLGICEQKLGIAEKIAEQNQEVSFDLSHKNMDNSSKGRLLEEKISEIVKTMDELTLEYQKLNADITDGQNSRDKENERGEELDARVSALNIKMEAVLKALKQAQSDAEAEQLKRIEISAKRLATHIRKWDSEEAKALELEQELEKLEKLYTRLCSVELTLTREYQDTKVILQNTGDEIVALEYETMYYKKRRVLADGGEGDKSKDAKVLVKVDGDADADASEVLNLVNPEIAPKKKDAKPNKAKVEKTKQVYFTKKEDGELIAIDVNKPSLTLGNQEYKYVQLNANPLQKISDKVHYYKEEIGKAVRSLSACRSDVVTENSVLSKLESNIESETKELSCAQNEIKEVYERLEECEIKLQEVQEQVLLIDENNKALVAENDAGNKMTQQYLENLKEYREQVHAIQLKIANQHSEIASLQTEIDNEKEHEAVVIRMIANIKTTIERIGAKTIQLQKESDCPTLAEQENEQKLVLVKGAHNEANTRVIAAEKNMFRKKNDIEVREGKIKLLIAKTNAMRSEINKISENEFIAELPSPKFSEHVERHIRSEEESVGSGAAPFYSNHWTWLLMILSFAGGYFAFGYTNNKSSDHYEQILTQPSEIALEKI